MDNDTQAPPEPEGFQSQRVRTLADMHRATDNRMIAGVCAGAARYLNIDPVVLRIILVVLTFAGLAGPILYIAAWFLLPEEGSDRSIAADWFNLDENEPQVRSAGLIIAAVIAVAAVVGDSAWDTEWIIWPVLVVAFFYWLFAVRPRRKRAELARIYAETGVKPTELQIEEYKSAKVAEHLQRIEAREPRSKALVGLTLSAVLIGLAATWLVDLSGESVVWTAYIAVALTIIGVGLLVGTLFGHGGPLIAIGIVLAIVLGVGMLPTGPVGEQIHRPQTIAETEDTYVHGIGELEIDLSDLDPDELAGQRISVEAGIGHTIVLLPGGVDAKIDAHLGTGELEVFGQVENGRDNNINFRSDDDGERPFVLVLDQKIGNLEVVAQ